VQQYYENRGVWPRQILLPCELEGQEAIQELLTQKAEHKVSLEVPQRGERRRLMESAVMNAKEEILRATTVQQRGRKTLEWLQRALELPAFPERIEAFDISNLGDTGIVAGMTVHVDGKAKKSDYRKFRIRDLETQDDYASMYQAVYRRFKHYVDGDERFMPLPDLLLIDGGEVHADTARRAVHDLGLDVPIFGMVKDDRHRTRALVSPDGHEIGIQQNQAVFALIGTIQEDTHNYAITYQRSLRQEAYGTSLDKIPGVGAKRRDDLIKAFKSVRAIREATVEQMKLVVPKNTAQAVYDYYHTQAEEEESICASSAEVPEEEN
jgi:excinuclease ABC subunit C